MRWTSQPGFSAAILPGSVAVDRIAELSRVWVAGRIPVLVPSLILQEIERSGTAPLAPELGYDFGFDRRMDRGPPGCRRPSSCSRVPRCPSGADRQLAARLERVDREFPRIARILPRVEYLNLRDPCRRS